MDNGQQIFLDRINVRVIPAHLLPLNTLFRYRERWWKKTSFNEGVALTSQNVRVQFFPTHIVAVRREDLPSQIYTNCI